MRQFIQQASWQNNNAAIVTNELEGLVLELSRRQYMEKTGEMMIWSPFCNLPLGFWLHSAQKSS
jgi:hypothetical protein